MDNAIFRKAGAKKMETKQTLQNDISEELMLEAQRYAEEKLSELNEKRRKRVRTLIRVGIMLTVTSAVLIFTAVQIVNM